MPQPPKKKKLTLKQYGDSINKYVGIRSKKDEEARKANEHGSTNVARTAKRASRIADSRAGKFYNDSVKSARKKP
jgi:hypothetical protein